jgi:hypothetical protein
MGQGSSVDLFKQIEKLPVKTNPDTEDALHRLFAISDNSSKGYLTKEEVQSG